MSRMLIVGCGYTGTVVARSLIARGWTVTGTRRAPDGVAALEKDGISGLVFDGAATPALDAAMTEATHLLVSVAPPEGGDVVLSAYGPSHIAASFGWIGYLSTVGVYGDAGGSWIDEDEPRTASGTRNQRRIVAEDEWMGLGDRTSVQVFRLAGIYGPGRSAFDRLRAGTARAIIKPGQVFNRIHVDDIATTVLAAIDRPAEVGQPVAYNVADDEPAPPQDVIDHAADLLALSRPPRIDFATADLSPMARSFYADCKRVRNDRIKARLGVSLLHPTYRDGLKSILAFDESSA